MSKSWKRGGDRKYQEDFEIYSKNEQEFRRHKEEKKLAGALRSNNVAALVEDEDDCEYCGDGDRVPAKGYWRCPKCDAEWNVYDNEEQEEEE